MVDDGRARDEFALTKPNIGVHIPPLIWATQFNYSADAVLLVIASDNYDRDDYIRDYDTYLELVTKSDLAR